MFSLNHFPGWMGSMSSSGRLFKAWTLCMLLKVELELTVENQERKSLLLTQERYPRTSGMRKGEDPRCIYNEKKFFRFEFANCFQIIDSLLVPFVSCSSVHEISLVLI